MYSVDVVRIQSISQCTSCGHEYDDVDNPSHPTKKELDLVYDLAEMLHVLHNCGTSKPIIQKNIIELSTAEGWDGLRAVAKKSGVNYLTIHRWFAENAKPQLNYLIKISESYSKRIHELLIRKDSSDMTEVSMPAKTRYQSSFKLSRINQYRRQLSLILESRHELGTLESIAAELGTTTVTLKRHFPELCNQILSLRKHRALDEALTRMRKISSSNVQEFLYTILKSKIRPYPSLEAIAKAVRLSPATLRNQYPELCNQITSTGKSQRIDETKLEAVREYLTQLDGAKNETIVEIAKKFGVSKASLYYHFPDLCARRKFNRPS